VVDKLGCCVLRAACLGATTSTVGASPAGPAAQQPASQHASIIGFVPSAGASRLAPTPDTLTSVPVAGRALLARRQRPPACRGCMAGLGVGAGSRWWRGWSGVKVIVVVVCASRRQTAGRRQQTADSRRRHCHGHERLHNARTKTTTTTTATTHTQPQTLAVGGRRPLPLFSRPPAPQRALWPAGW
jgi:hypothetical protein